MWIERIKEAHRSIKDEVRATPLEYSPVLSQRSGANVYLKLENYQVTGSFKIRGVMNKLASLSEQDIENGLVACSTGNHGAAFAYAVDKFGYDGLLFLPHNVSKAKLEALKYYNVDLDFFGDDCVVTEDHARRVAAEQGKPLIHPYNDPDVVSGQGTIALEIMEQSPFKPDRVIVPIGGGGMISGIASYLKEHDPAINVIGCQPENSAVMKRSLAAGQIIEEESLPTLSDATAGGIEANSITFDLCQQFVDGIHLITEAEIRDGIRDMIKYHHMVVEGAAAMTVATLLKHKYVGENVVLIICGKKISLEQLKSCLQ